MAKSFKISIFEGGGYFFMPQRKSDKKPKKNGRQNYDWEKLKTEYVTSDISLKQLAEEHDIRYRTVADRSRNEGWVSARKSYQAKVTNRAISKVATKQANALAKELDVCDKISDVLQKALGDAEQFNRHIVLNEYVADNGDVVRVTEEQTLNKIDTRALKEVASTLKLVEEMKRSMMSIQTMEQHNRELREKRKLQMEEERLELEKKKSEQTKVDKDISISIGGFEEGWTK